MTAESQTRPEVHLRFDAADYARLKAEAERQGRTVASLVRFWTRQRIVTLEDAAE